MRSLGWQREREVFPPESERKQPARRLRGTRERARWKELEKDGRETEIE